MNIDGDDFCSHLSIPRRSARDLSWRERLVMQWERVVNIEGTIATVTVTALLLLVSPAPAWWNQELAKRLMLSCNPEMLTYCGKAAGTPEQAAVCLHRNPRRLSLPCLSALRGG